MLEVGQLSVYYGSIQALDEVSLQVDEGELVAILGANGAGKSTLLKAISGLLRPRSGHIRFAGREITAAPAHTIVAAGIVHVPEGRQVFNSLSVAENLRLGAYQRHDRQAVEEDRERVFELFPILKERYRQAAGTLSGGEQQMLAIGRGLMSRPGLLLLDEPSLGLAPLITQLIFDVIRQLREKGMTILVVEQNAYQALGIANRAYVMETGRIKLSGASAELMCNPEIKAAYLGGQPSLEDRA